MKVALVGPYPLLDPLRIDGGVEAAIHSLVLGLESLGNLDIHVIADTKRVAYDSEIRCGNVIIHYLTRPKNRIIPNMITGIGRIRRVIEKIEPDIVHAVDACGIIAGVNSGCPTILTVHGITYKEQRYCRRRFSQWLTMGLSNRLAHIAVANAKHVIAVSSYVAREYAECASGRVSVIPNAVDDAFFQVQGTEDPGLILYVGHVEPLKNIFGLIRAFKLVRDACPQSKLALAGAIRDKVYYYQILDYAAANGLSESIHFYGLLNQEELIKEYAKSAIICTFSQHETFSLTVAQGMAAGKPTVASDSGGPSDFVIEQETGFLVPVGDEAAFADRCVRLLNDADLRDEMGRRARGAAKSRFSKQNVASKTALLYQQMLEGQRQRG